jgi:hypothetical protein
MAFFKRIEVWLLLGLSVVGVGWVLWSEQSRELSEKRDPPTKTSDQETAGGQPPKFEITGRRLSREGEHLVLSLRVKRATDSAEQTKEDLNITDANTRLVSDEGQSVQRFFLPFDPEPILESHSGAEVTLRYWFPVAESIGNLWLEIDGERLPVKSSNPEVPTGNFPQGVEIAVEGTNWER